MVSLFLAGPVFMCQLCNLFSPSRSPLLAHCSHLHPEAHPDDIITVLQPLVAAPVETPEGQNHCGFTKSYFLTWKA